MISSAQTCAPKQSVGARDVRCLAIRAREVLIYKEIDSWAARNAFPKWQEGRHPHCHFRGLLRLHSRYGPPDRSAAHRRFAVANLLPEFVTFTGWSDRDS
jgi:hypothetical protein